jgi:sortase A
MGPLRRGLRETGLGLITAGVVILLFVTYQLFGTALAEEHSQSKLKKQFSQAIAANRAAATSSTSSTPTTGSPASTGAGGKPTGTTPGGGAPPTTASAGGGGVGEGDAPTVGAPPVVETSAGALDHLVIPRIGVDKYVVQGVGEDNLRQGPGHYPQTVLPGQVGNAAIAGHRTTYGAPFFRLDELHIGDPVDVTDTQGREYVYTVFSTKVVSPGDVAVLDPTPDAELTLTTCNPRFSATSRLVVHARLTSTVLPSAPAPAPSGPTPAAPASTGRVSPAPAAPTAADATLGSGDAKAWPPAVGWGIVVLLGWIGVRLLVNRTRRWRRAGALIGGIALCLIPLWYCFENVVRLLPQNI